MAERGIVVGFYPDPSTARPVLQELRRRRFLRSALLSRGTDDRLHIDDYDVSTPTAALLGGFVGLIASLVFLILLFRTDYAAGLTASLPASLAYIVRHPLWCTLTLTTFGAVLGALLGRLIDFGVKEETLTRYRRWVVEEECLVLVETLVEHAGEALDILRQTATSPITFVIYPDRALSPGPEENLLRDQPLTQEHLQREAGRLAAEVHVVSARKTRGRPLLKRIRESERVLRRVCDDLSEAARQGQSISLSGEWLLDNAHVLLGHIDECQRSLPRAYYEELPVVSSGTFEGLPRIYAIAAEIVRDTDARLDRDILLNFLQSYQSVTPLTMGELWAFPLMLRLRLTEVLRSLTVRVEKRQRERELADFYANRLLTAVRRDPEQLLSFVAELARDVPEPSTYFADQLISHLYDEDIAVTPVRTWLERKLGASFAEVIQQKHRHEAMEQTSLSNAITSLRQLSQIDWRECFEVVNRVDAILFAEPSGVYPQMDFATRDQYRHAIEEIAKGSGSSEIQIALLALEKAEAGEDALRQHVGYHLIDAGRSALEASVRSQPPFGERTRRQLRKHPTAFYLLSLFLLTGGLLAAVLLQMARSEHSPVLIAFLGILSLLPASEIASQLLNYLVTRLLPPRPLPKMSFDGGVPDEFKTLVVVPMMLLTPESIRDEVERLEIRYLANPDPSLRFALLSDYSDAPRERMPDDIERVEVAVRGIEALNEKYGAGKFFLFHRQRVWSESERCWMGWERKRGKLEDLNRFLMGEADATLDAMLHVGDAGLLRDIRFVLTLDADTQVPRDTVRRMVETLAHPLNRPVLSEDGRKVLRGYTILQPRVSTSLPSANATLFSRLFTDAAGTDPYTHVVSDVYQDLFGEGSYHGKGIYDLQAFHRVLSGRFPDAHLLSHDLIEGAHVRVGIVSDIELLDLLPRDYITYAGRQHRWVRGDWQIADWILPRVPAGHSDTEKQETTAAPRRVRNPLSLFDRWKIFDNLRRSLLPVGTLAALIIGWTLTSAPAFWSLFLGISLFMPTLVQILGRLTTKPVLDAAYWRDLGTTLLRNAVFIALVPHQAGLTADAVCRVMVRRITRHKMLEWETAAEAHRKSKDRQKQFLWRMSWIPFLSVLLLLWGRLFSLAAENAMLSYALAWILSPMIVQWLGQVRNVTLTQRLSTEERVYIRQVARQTWRFFATFVTEQTNWLPPDNYEDAPRVEVAERTSPTNIGLLFLADLSAYDFGYLTLDDLIRRSGNTMTTLDRLERYEGHLLNWYDTRTLEPLRPRYVSTVDSGNLLGDLWAMEQGMQGVLDAPLLKPSALRGLSDALGLLREALDAGGGRRRKVSPEGRAAAKSALVPLLATLEKLCLNPPSELEGLCRRLQNAREPARSLAERVEQDTASSANARYWAAQVHLQVEAWNEQIGRYFSWYALLATPPEGGLMAFGREAHEWRREALAAVPSLRELAANEVPGLRAFTSLQQRASELNLSQRAADWLNQVAEATHRAQWFAGEQVAQAEEWLKKSRKLAAEMNFRFLYDPLRRLMYTGYSVEDRRYDAGYYDMLASEARLASFVCVARGELPTEHWWALGRPIGSAYGMRTLLSWSGTLFEYLMPTLLTRTFENSLLDQACRSAVEGQIVYARRRGIPWGISEAAHSELDSRQIYQYRAFGVPGLGMKRGLEEDLVVAPYAAALALEVQPAAAVKNLRELERVERVSVRGGERGSVRGDYGFYESIDYTRQQGPEGQRGIIVHCYMAHHQGMLFVAINNALHDDIMQQRFHADPRVRATESLLYEKIPIAPPLTLNPMRVAPPSRLRAAEAAPASGYVDRPDTSAPRVGLLANGDYALMVTNAGGGYSRWGDFEITRWRADTTCDGYGQFLYLKDVESGVVWSAAYHPTGAPATMYGVLFTPEKIEFKRRNNGIETVTEIVVSPEDQVEVRRITLINRSLRPRTIEVTSYAEIALAPHSADRAHPAFSKLFVQTEALPEDHALLAWRRPRSAHDAPIWAAQLVTVNGEHSSGDFTYETDRAKFLGRGRTPHNPIALAGYLSNTAGAVLDPVFSLRRRVTIQPGERVELSFVMMARPSRDEVVTLVQKYRDFGATTRALELAWTHAQLELRHLRIKTEDVQRYQQLGGHILYPNALLRPPAERLRRSRLGQSRLWAYGISGDLPIIVLTISDTADLDMARQLLQAHTYLRLRGVKADLVILNEEASTYEQPILNQLRRLVQAQTQYTGMDVAGGVFIRPAAQLSEEDLTLLLTAARIVLVAARGSLTQQLSSLGSAQAPAASPLPRAVQVREEPSPPLPFMELPYFNGLGGFTPDGREYAIYLGPEDQTPVPWSNVIANPSFGALITEAGAGYAWYGNSQSNRLMPWSNDPVSDPVSDAIYIRDEELGRLWSPTPLPIRERDAYRTRHGQGYSVFEHNSHAIEQELTVFVPVDDQGGAPVRVQILRLKNHSSRRRRLTVTSYVEWTLGVEREDTQIHVNTNWDTESQSLLARNAYHPDFGTRIAFQAVSLPVVSYTGDRTEFLGRNGSTAHPLGLERERLSGRIGAGIDPCGALQVAVELEPNQQTEIVFLLGQAADVAEARQLIRQFRDRSHVQQSLRTTRDWWDHFLSAVQVETPEAAANMLLNRWLLYQDMSCRIWGRSAFYQSGGAFGYRDQLQDVMALVYTAPQFAREQIVKSASRQFVEGDVQHWWHPPSGAGVRTRITDDLLWLPFVAAQYVRVTGDTSLLDERVPFLEGKVLEPQEHELFFPPSVSQEEATVLEHCRRAIEKGDTKGAHGLPLIGGGDWNDGLNRVGIEGKGESVWLAWFLVHVLNDFAELLTLRGEQAVAETYHVRSRELVNAIETQAWDGEWYRRAYFDDGTPLGSKDSEEAKIDSLAQSWSVISGAGDAERSRIALRSAEEYLVRDKDKLVLLFTPAFDHSPHDPGYIKGYLPGVRENGGQYTHGSLWVPLALAKMGEGDRAVHLLQLMNPIEHAKTPSEVQKYKVEPYVAAADVYALENQHGRGGWTWYTGSAGWMYRVWIEGVLGLTVRGETLRLTPALPSDWPGYKLRYRHRTSHYEIVVEQTRDLPPNTQRWEEDGHPLDTPEASLRDDGQTHRVHVLLGRTLSRDGIEESAAVPMKETVS